MKTHPTIAVSLKLLAWSNLVLLGCAALTVLAECAVAAAASESPTPPAAAAPAATDKSAERPIDIGGRKQLLIDDHLFANSENIAFHMNRPTKMGPVLLPDKPWESTDIGFCVSVIEDEGRYKMWYLARDKEDNFFICYAWSKDGVVWEKPNLGVFDYHGSKDNNIVLLSGTKEWGETTVFLDPAGLPDARFKTISHVNVPDPKKAGLYVHTSPDGIHWKMSQERVLPLGSDSANLAFFDSRLKKYVVYMRVWAPYRKVGRVETDDITKPWPFQQIAKPKYMWGKDRTPVASHEVPLVFGYDEQDPPKSDHYESACVQYPWAADAYFMFPAHYRHFPDPPIGKYENDGLVDIQMASSRDGIAWTRVSRDPYLSLGTQGEIDCAQLHMAIGMLRRGGKLFQYYTGYPFTHGAWDFQPMPSGGICRLEQRLDGFVSADAGPEGGEFTTRPLVCSGGQLALNVDAGAMGTCKVEILDQQGNAIPGFSLADCDAVQGNHVEKTISWKGKTDLSSLRGRVVGLRVVLRACKLFAFQFAAGEKG